jgi:hypothetical protein
MPATRSAADPLNLKPQAARLEIRRHFSQIEYLVEEWNLVPKGIKNARSVQLQESIKKITKRKWWRPPNMNQRWFYTARGVNHNWRPTPPKRFYLDHRRTIYK